MKFEHSFAVHRVLHVIKPTIPNTEDKVNPSHTIIYKKGEGHDWTLSTANYIAKQIIICHIKNKIQTCSTLKDM